MVRFGSFLAVTTLLLLCSPRAGAEDFLLIRAECLPRSLLPGAEGQLHLNIQPRPERKIRIAGQPELIVRLDEQSALIFNKVFFTASELDFPSRMEDGLVLLEMDREITIPFRMAEAAPPGPCPLSGEVVFTAVFPDGWSMKTFQKFSVSPVKARRGGS